MGIQRRLGYAGGWWVFLMHGRLCSSCRRACGDVVGVSEGLGWFRWVWGGFREGLGDLGRVSRGDGVLAGIGGCF